MKRNQNQLQEDDVPNTNIRLVKNHLERKEKVKKNNTAKAKKKTEARYKNGKTNTSKIQGYTTNIKDALIGPSFQKGVPKPHVTPISKEDQVQNNHMKKRVTGPNMTYQQSNDTENLQSNESEKGENKSEVNKRKASGVY